MNAVLGRLPILVLEPHSRCNCRCVMCDIWKNTDARELSAAELERHLDDIVRLRVEWVVFSGGEPLMHTDLFRLCSMLRERAIRVTILSTGLLLERYAAPIRAHTDDVIVSLDGPAPIHDEIRGAPGAFARLAAGLRALGDHPVSARCTVQARNASHLRAAVQTARELGLRSISFLAADLISTAFNRPLSWPVERQSAVAPELPALEREIGALIAAYPQDGFVRESPAKLRRIVAHFRAHYGLEAPVAPRCNAPWVSAVVEANGDVRPCFFHPAVGNLAEGLSNAINGAAAVTFREALDVASDPTCRKCVCSLYV
jgi:MoaA/NifB/PqqE/SkfB family radical SAM enzyme